MCQQCREMEHYLEVVKVSNIPDPDKENLLIFLNGIYENQLDSAVNHE